MKALAFTRRELRENRLVWAGAAFTAAMAWAWPWLGHLRGGAPEGTTQAAVVAAHLGCVLAVAGFLAFRGIPGDLGDRRFSFDLAQPAGLGALVAGRLLGAWLLAIGGGAVVLAPALLVRSLPWGHGLGLIGLSGALALPVLLGGHLLGIAWRSRSAWILADLAAVALFLRGQAALAQGLLRKGGAWLDGFALATGLLLVLLLALAVGLPLAQGRTDLARVRARQSLVLGAGLALLTALGCLLVLFVRS